MAQDGAFRRFDAPGTRQTIAILTQTKKNAGVRIDVVSEREGDAIQVQTIQAS